MRPAINVGLSVSRVGGNAQIKAMKQVAGRLRLDLAQYREMEAFARFGTDLDEMTLKQLARGRRLVEILKQLQYVPMLVSEQVVVLFAGVNGYLDDIELGDIKKFETKFLEYMKGEHKSVLEKIELEKQISDELKEELTKLVEAFKAKEFPKKNE